MTLNSWHPDGNKKKYFHAESFEHNNLSLEAQGLSSCQCIVTSHVRLRRQPYKLILYYLWLYFQDRRDNSLSQNWKQVSALKSMTQSLCLPQWKDSYIKFKCIICFLFSFIFDTDLFKILSKYLKQHMVEGGGMQGLNNPFTYNLVCTNYLA